MGMSISSSGRRLDQPYLSPKVLTFASSSISYRPNAIPKDKIIEMLRIENKYRLSNEWLVLMEKEAEKMEYPMKTIDALQREVAKECGFEKEEDIENAIEFLRSAIATL